MRRIRVKRSASSIVDCAPRCAEPHAERPRATICNIQRRQTLDKSITSFVGLDVHRDSTAIAEAQAVREAPRFLGTVGPDLGQLLKALKSVGKPETMLVVYEAGPCGYGLARQRCLRGYSCEVVAAGKIARRPGERIKTDRRDALMLARLARSGDLVKVPDERDEARRDLSRAREDAVRARLKARQQRKALWLRHGHRYGGKSSWTLAHERYLAAVGFAHPAQDLAFAEYRQAVREGHARVERLTAALRAQTEQWRLKPLVAALSSWRGIGFVAAVTLAAEIGDFSRFAHPTELRGFLGLVPSEHSTGETRRQGDITKTGNGHARRARTGGGGRELSLPRSYQSRSAAAARRPAQSRARDRLASAAAPGPPLSALELAQVAPEQGLRRHCSRARRLSVGYRPPGQSGSLSSRRTPYRPTHRR